MPNLPINEVTHSILQFAQYALNLANNHIKEFQDNFSKMYETFADFHKYHKEELYKCRNYFEKEITANPGTITIDKLCVKIENEILSWENNVKATDIISALESLKQKSFFFQGHEKLFLELNQDIIKYLAHPFFSNNGTLKNFLYTKITKFQTQASSSHPLENLIRNLISKLSQISPSNLSKEEQDALDAISLLKEQLDQDFKKVEKNYLKLRTKVAKNVFGYIRFIILRYPIRIFTSSTVVLSVLAIVIPPIITSVTEPKLEGTYNYAGSTTWRAIHHEIDERIQKKFPKLHLNYDEHMSESGSNSAIKKILKG